MANMPAVPEQWLSVSGALPRACRKEDFAEMVIAEGGEEEGPAEEQYGAQLSSQVYWHWPSFVSVWVLAEQLLSSGASWARCNSPVTMNLPFLQNYPVFPAA